MYHISTRNCYEYDEVNRRESRRESCVVGVNLAICWLRAKVSWIFCWVNSARNARSSVSAWLRSYKKVSKKKWHQFNFNFNQKSCTYNLFTSSIIEIVLSSNFNELIMKMTEHAIFLYFFFLVSIANKKKKKHRGKCATTKYSLACKFLFFFLFEIYLPFFNYGIFQYLKNIVFCSPFFRWNIDSSFFLKLLHFRFNVRFYYICAEMHWNTIQAYGTLKHLILITFVFKTSLTDYFDVMLIFMPLA